MLWVVFIAMTIAALAIILFPIWRQSARTTGRSAYDIEVYRDQLEELDRDVERGLIGEDEADAARAEIGRRLLAADAASQVDTEPTPAKQRPAWIAGVLALSIPAMAAAFYGFLGAPGLPSLPAAERQAAPAPDRNVQRDQLIARLNDRLRENPDDGEAWSHLGTLLMSAGRYGDAAKALGEAGRRTPESAALLARQGEALSMSNQGRIGDEARQIFESALKIDPREPRARFYLGMADYQAGRSQDALARWRALEAETPPDAPWRAPLRAQIARLAAELGEPAPSTDSAAPGPTAEDVEAASQMSGQDRQAMIRSMVTRLAERLAETPDDADGWLRLGRSYRVLGEAAKSQSAYAKAAALRPDDVSVLTQYVTSIASVSGPESTKRLEFNDTVDKILGLDPNNPTALWFRGLRAREAGDTVDAAKHWRKLLGMLDPSSREHGELSRRLSELETN